MGIVLLKQRQFRRFAYASALELAIATLYVLPLAYVFGDPLATVHSYQPPNLPGPQLFGFPFYAIVEGTLLYPASWTNLVLTFGWVLVLLSRAYFVSTVIIFRTGQEEAFHASRFPCFRSSS
jgi:hypothetical protein